MSISFSIPVWLMWVIAIPAVAYVVLIVGLGFLAVRTFKD